MTVRSSWTYPSLNGFSQSEPPLMHRLHRMQRTAQPVVSVGAQGVKNSYPLMHAMHASPGSKLKCGAYASCWQKFVRAAMRCKSSCMWRSRRCQRLGARGCRGGDLLEILKSLGEGTS